MKRLSGTSSLLTFLVLFFAAQVNAAILYVDKDSSCPGSGTTGAPYCSIQNAFNVVNAGDSIRIRDSATPYDANSILTRSGSAGSPITIEPDVGHNPTIRYTGSGGQTGAIHVRDASYIIIQNLTFDGAGVFTSRFGIYINAETTDVNGIQLLNNTVRNWGGSAAQASSAMERGAIGLAGGYCYPCSPARQVRGAIVRGNTVQDSRQTGIFLQHASDTLIENNTIFGIKSGMDADTGLQTLGIYISDAGPGGSSGTIIRGNTIRDFELRTSSNSTGITHTSGAYDTEAAIWCDVGPTNGLVENNTIYNINYSAVRPQDYNRNEMESQGVFIEADCTGWTTQKNVIYNIGGAGVRQRARSFTGSNSYLNNTIFNIGYNGIEMGNIGGSGGTGSAVIKNNIVMNARSSQISFDDATGNSFTVNWNIYFSNNGGSVGNWSGSGTSSFAAWKSACGCDGNSLNSNPLFVSTVTPDFHLQSSSPARGAGESGVDAGAYNVLGSVTWSNDRGGSGTASGTSSWTASNIPLQSGVNNITVTADDGAGNISTDQIAVTYAPSFSGNTLAGAWGFEEGSGVTATDSSGSNNNGTLVNAPSRVAGVHGGQGLSLNGTTQYVQAPDANSLDYTQSFTISAWVNPAASHSDFRAIAVKDYVIYLYASISGYCGSAGVLAGFYVNGSTEFTACSPTPLPIGTWTHVAASYDSVGASLKLYLNGVAVATTVASGFMEPTTGPFEIGHSQYGEFFQGLIDEVRTYNWPIPATAAGNTTPGASCVAADEISSPSIVGDMNCPVIALVPPLRLQIGADGTVKFGADAIFKVGQVP